MSAGIPVTPPLLPLSSSSTCPFLFPPAPTLLCLSFLSPLLSFPSCRLLSVLLFLSHPLGATVSTLQVFLCMFSSMPLICQSRYVMATAGVKIAHIFGLVDEPKSRAQIWTGMQDCVLKNMLIVGGRELGLNGGHDEVEAIGRARAPMQLRTAVWEVQRQRAQNWERKEGA